MASLPLPRFLERARDEREHANRLKRIIDHGDLDLRERTIYHDPADALTLRGIPAIGRGVQGVIRGTSPGAL